MIKLEADMHTHTVASTHAYSTITENCTFAASAGIKALGMTDHVGTMPDSPHCWHFHNYKILPHKINGVYVVHGAEANIVDYDGTLDLDKDSYRFVEWIIASYHKYTLAPASPKEHTQGYLKLAEDENIDMIGHPTTANFEYDMEKCVKKFKEYGKFIEINESSIMWKRGSRENALELMKLCKKYEAMICINTDAHFHELIGQTPIALQMAESIDFPEKLVANAHWETIRDHIIKKHPDVSFDR